MTWIEITFWVLLIGVTVLGFIVDVAHPATSYSSVPAFTFIFAIMFFFLFGALPYAIVGGNTPEIIVKEEPLKILSNTMVNGSMIIITDHADTVTFSSYADITNINSGKTLVKRFYETHVYYGPDSSRTSIEIK